jgi:NADH-quinone oxidoreductase subunit C
MSPWEGADYVLPGDEKARAGEAPVTPKTTDTPKQTGAGTAANAEAAKVQSAGAPAVTDAAKPAAGAPAETDPRPKGDKA